MMNGNKAPEKQTFATFIYNRQAGTFLGRNKKSWCKCIISSSSRIPVFCLLQYLPDIIINYYDDVQSKSFSSIWCSTSCWPHFGLPVSTSSCEPSIRTCPGLHLPALLFDGIIRSSCRYYGPDTIIGANPGLRFVYTDKYQLFI
jgi:hypothetical protein